MCLALPARIAEIHDDDTATVTLGGVRKQVSLALIVYATVLALVGAVMIGVVPALQAMRTDVVTALRAGAREGGRHSGGRR